MAKVDISSIKEFVEISPLGLDHTLQIINMAALYNLGSVPLPKLTTGEEVLAFAAIQGLHAKSATIN
jgi:hypothetical protein